jgi:hypothetical protein
MTATTAIRTESNATRLSGSAPTSRGLRRQLAAVGPEVAVALAQQPRSLEAGAFVRAASSCQDGPWRTRSRASR